jgi:hypothetical protein
MLEQYRLLSMLCRQLQEIHVSQYQKTNNHPTSYGSGVRGMYLIKCPLMLSQVGGDQLAGYLVSGVWANEAGQEWIFLDEEALEENPIRSDVIMC